MVPDGFGIQDVFRRLADDSERTAKIVLEIELAYSEGRKILVLTDKRQAGYKAMGYRMADSMVTMDLL